MHKANYRSFIRMLALMSAPATAFAQTPDEANDTSQQASIPTTSPVQAPNPIDGGIIPGAIMVAPIVKSTAPEIATQSSRTETAMNPVLPATTTQVVQNHAPV